MNHSKKEISFQVRTFWLSMMIQQVWWLWLAAVSIATVHFNWLVITLVALALNGANLMGYFRARFFSSESARPSFTETWTKPLTEKLSLLLRFGRHQGGGYTRADYN